MEADGVLHATGQQWPRHFSIATANLVPRRSRITTKRLVRDAPNERYGEREGGTIDYVGLAAREGVIPISVIRFAFSFV